MIEVAANPVLGIAYHAIGAASAAICYTPQKRVRGWSWQTYWITQALFCWFLLPIIGACLTIPDLRAVLAEAPRDAMKNSFLLGMLYGIGGTAFGIAIRYIGFSLTYAIAVGLSAVLGALASPLIAGKLGEIASERGGSWVLAGVFVGTLGIGFCGWAGRSKERDLQGQEAAKSFSLTKGLLISLLAGVLSAVYNFSLDAAQPIADVAAKHDAGIWEGNVKYIFANTGAFITTAIYCLFLSVRHKSLREFVELPAGEEQPSLPINFVMAIATGLLWYGQFFFYNLGHVRMGTYKFSSWAIHMTMLVLISNLVGVLLKEWRDCTSRTRKRLYLALIVLVAAVTLFTLGTYVKENSTA